LQHFQSSSTSYIEGVFVWGTSLVCTSLLHFGIDSNSM
jgi:hypothetical protein